MIWIRSPHRFFNGNLIKGIHAVLHSLSHHLVNRLINFRRWTSSPQGCQVWLGSWPHSRSLFCTQPEPWGPFCLQAKQLKQHSLSTALWNAFFRIHTYWSMVKHSFKLREFKVFAFPLLTSAEADLPERGHTFTHREPFLRKSRLLRCEIEYS